MATSPGKEAQLNVVGTANVEKTECTFNDIKNKDADESHVEHRQESDTPQKPLLKSVEKARSDVTPELPVFKSKAQRALNFERTPSRTATVSLSSDNNN